MATVWRRALYVVRWYEVPRVLSVSSTLVTTKSCRNDTWCKRWCHITQRNFSVTTSSFAPSLSSILAKEMGDSRASKDHKPRKSTKDEVEGKDPGTAEVAAAVTVSYHRGLPKITVPLPSRNENCVFILKPITHTVGDFIQMLKKEDRGIDHALIRSIDGVRIGSNNTVESLLESDFRLIINDMEYLVTPPLHHSRPIENSEPVESLLPFGNQMSPMVRSQEHLVRLEREVLAELETIRVELEPLEQKLQELEISAQRRTNIFIWVCLAIMSVQFSFLARLTWWEYSWDIMEPVTYFVNYGTTIIFFIYFALTRQEYMLPDVMSRRQLITLHKKAKKMGFDLDHYNRLKERVYELDTILKIIRGPLYDYQQRIEQKKRERSSSSSSRSPSSSPSPSPSPSPERTFPKRGIFPQKGESKKRDPWTNKETRDC